MPIYIFEYKISVWISFIDNCLLQIWQKYFLIKGKIWKSQSLESISILFELLIWINFKFDSSSIVEIEEKLLFNIFFSAPSINKLFHKSTPSLIYFFRELVFLIEQLILFCLMMFWLFSILM